MSNMRQELNEILGDDFKEGIIQKLEELKDVVNTNHERFWTREVTRATTNKPLDALKAISFDDSMSIADRLVMTIVYNSETITTDELLQLTGMSVGGLRRIVLKLLQASYILKIKNGLYKAYDKQIF